MSNTDHHIIGSDYEPTVTLHTVRPMVVEAPHYMTPSEVHADERCQPITWVVR